MLIAIDRLTVGRWRQGSQLCSSSLCVLTKMSTKTFPPPMETLEAGGPLSGSSEDT